MRTPTSFSLTTAAAMRRHFALTQAELARWLGVTTRHVEAAEAGRREFSPAVEKRLWRLEHLMHPFGPALPVPTVLPPAPPQATQIRAEAGEAEQLRRRVRRCQHLARQLAYQLENLALQDAALLCRRQGLAALRLALAIPPLDGLTSDPAEEATWLSRLEADTAALPPRPGPLARAHLVLRHRLLLEEAEALTQLLTSDAEPTP